MEFDLAKVPSSSGVGGEIMVNRPTLKLRLEEAGRSAPRRGGITMNPTEPQIAERHAQIRKEALVRRVCHNLRATIKLYGITPETRVDDVRVEMTDASAAIIAQLVEAVDILDGILWASEGCFVVGTVRRRTGLGIRGYDADKETRFTPTDGYELCDACAKALSEYLRGCAGGESRRSA